MEQKLKKIKYMCPQACSNHTVGINVQLPASVSVPLFSTSPTCSCSLPERGARGSGRRCDGAAGSPRAASRLRRCLGAIVCGVELGAISYSAEIAPTSTPCQFSGKYLSAMSYGAETCYLVVLTLRV